MNDTFKVGDRVLLPDDTAGRVASVFTGPVSAKTVYEVERDDCGYYGEQLRLIAPREAA